jgi:hypothetical protein
MVEQHSVPVIYRENGPHVCGADPPHEESYDYVEGHKSIEPPCLLGRRETRDALTKLAQACYNRYKAGTLDTTDLSGVVRFNVFHAFALNARVLGFNDDWLTYEATSPFNMAGDAIWRLLPERRPPRMEPTSLQLTVEHHPWIDFFPCPRLRDNLLKAVEPGHESVDEDALCHDVVDAGARGGIGSAALLVWGNPWEPSGWEVTESFFTKWGWLLDGCTEMVEATNYWRQKRGLKSLEDDVLRLQACPRSVA